MPTLTVTIKEEVVLDGSDHGSETIVNIDGVEFFYERSLGCTQTEVSIFSFSATQSGSTFETGSLQYLRITNQDSSEFAIIRVLGNNEEYFVKLPPKDSFVLFSDEMDSNDTGSASPSLADMEDIKIQVDPAALGNPEIKIAIFAAS